MSGSERRRAVAELAVVSGRDPANDAVGLLVELASGLATLDEWLDPAGLAEPAA